ncbi:hypothetical protein GS501_01910 [Saccharibacter sp. 17.LH.SD]|uniref:ABC transporter substrate-binding protein n=1 Tax=Saccharibacter sp. 17.LH.SD TaxID=2689393 RepID=UPI00136FECF0|nr:ABC transporter substrate-binding protein [Saccharibacter sp. 17.LH.SD]MXV43809.1 hypothetical protein [Saccharibacter sp. 17.LH.SD]
MNMNRRFMIHTTRSVLLVGSLFVASGLSVTPIVSAAHAASNTNESAATTPIQGLYAALQKAETDGDSADKRSTIIGPAVDQAFDLSAILRRSIGLRFDHLSADERSQLLAAFQRFTAAHYASTFKPGTDAVFMVSPTTKKNSTGGTVVHTTIRGKADPVSDATSIDYVMSQTPQGWRIIDILLNGHISQVAVQRSDFRAIFGQSGASGLTKNLTQKADDFLHE